MSKIFSFIAGDIGIDLGTINTIVYADKKGIVINEPSVVAIDINTGEIVAVGQKAWDMIGKTPSNIVSMRPLEEGVISDYEITQAMLKYFIDKSVSGFSFLSPRVVVSIPSGITDVEKRAVEDAVLQVGARDVLLVEESIASAVGMGLPVYEPKGNMLVNIGGGTTEVAVISLGGIVCSKSIFIGGDKFNSLIIDHVKDEYELMIGYSTAEEIKLEIASAVDVEEDRVISVSGRDLVSGLPEKKDIKSKAISKLIRDQVYEIADGIKSVLERTPPELSADIMQNGIYLTGGSVKLKGLSQILAEAVSMPFTVDQEPMLSAGLGTGELIKKFNEIKKSRITK
ncbi:MAG: rod shape-determining protein [Tissierellia bacterium]|nr:rod shape-determining protein [Tissierellia bacterium]